MAMPESEVLDPSLTRKHLEQAIAEAENKAFTCGAVLESAVARRVMAKQVYENAIEDERVAQNRLTLSIRELAKLGRTV